MFVSLFDFLKRDNDYRFPHLAVVLDNYDPDQLGRLKVGIVGMFPDDADPSTLPWVCPETPADQGGTGSASSFVVPEVGTQVLVRFPFDDIYFGFYSSYWQSDLTHQGRFNEDYPYSHGFESPDGTSLKMNKTRNALDFLHSSGFQFSIDPDNKVITVSTPYKLVFQSPHGGSSVSIDPDTGTITEDSPNSKVITADLNIQNSQRNETTGTITENVTGAKQVTLGGSHKLGVGGSQSTSVVSNDELTVGQNRDMVIAAFLTEVMGTGHTETVVTGNWLKSVLAGNIVLASLLSSLALPASGMTDLEGIMVLLQGGTEPMVLGQSLFNWLQAMTLPTGIGPTGTADMSQALNWLSKKAFVG